MNGYREQKKNQKNALNVRAENGQNKKDMQTMWERIS